MMVSFLQDVVFIVICIILSVFRTVQTQNFENGDNNPVWQNNFEFKSSLLQNGLKLILIRDPNATKTAASLYIGAGSMNEPPNMNGLAHLLEHVVFSGNTKYPQQDFFETYAASNGGGVSAYVGMDHTHYAISCLPDAIEGAVDRLFHLVDSPLLLDSVVRDEISIVNSEFVKYFPDDYKRYDQIGLATARLGHPFRIFTTGNIETLSTKPIQLGINITTELQKFHELYYSSNLMTLTISGKQETKDLESMVVPLFEKLVNRNATLVSWPDDENPPYNKSETGVKIEILAKNALQFLSLEFSIPKDTVDIFNNYYVPLCSNPGVHSLYSFLKSRHFITNLITEVKTRYRGFQEFLISLSLTDYGIVHHEEAVLHVFEFINSLRENGNSSAQKWYWDEVEWIEDIKNRYKVKDDPYRLTTVLGKKSIEENVTDVLSDYLSHKRIPFNQTNVLAALNYITPENMRMYFISDSVTNTTLLEHNYGIEYKIEDITPQLFKRLKYAKTNPNMKFPQKNLYIPSNFTLIDAMADMKKVPRKLKSTNFSRILYLQDWNKYQYLVPKVFIRVKTFIPFAYSTPINVGLISIFCQILTEILRPVTRQAALVETQAYTYNSEFGLITAIHGYNNGADRLLEKIMETIANASNFLTNETFNAVKEIYKKSLNDRLNYQPCSLADTDILLRDTNWGPKHLIAVLDDLKLESLQGFYADFMSRIKMEWFLYGNTDEMKATQLVASCEDFFVKQGSRPMLDDEYQWQLRNVQIPQENKYYVGYKMFEMCVKHDLLPYASYFKGTNWMYKMETTTRDSASTCTFVSFQSEHLGLEDSVKMAFLDRLMNTAAFFELRTKQQLGYGVSMYSRGEMESSGNLFIIYVQGEKDPNYVEDKINGFLLQYRETLKNMSHEEFSSRKLTQYQIYQIWDKDETDLGMLGHKYWVEIMCGHYNFKRNSQRQQIINKLTLQELQSFYDDLFGLNVGKQRRLSIHVVPQQRQVNKNSTNIQQNEQAFIKTNSTEIIDPVSWKRSCYLFPTPGLDNNVMA